MAAAISAEPLKELRIGYQKIGALLIVKEKKVLEQRFEPQGVRVRWIEFAFGPPLLEALGAGAIDYGYTGDFPPIFAQAARANLLYAGGIPARGYGQAIVVPAASSIQEVAGLAGKKVAVAKASSAHNLLVAALQSIKPRWSAITPVYLPPPDAAAAFVRGAVDAWSIWDPFFAIAELKQKARALSLEPERERAELILSRRWELRRQTWSVVATINDAVATATTWADQRRDQICGHSFRGERC